MSSAKGARAAWRPFWRARQARKPSGSGPLAVLMRTGYFRQAACFAYFFLLVTLASMLWGQHLLEQVLVTHVKDMVTAEIRMQQMLDAHGSAEHLAQVLGQREAYAPRSERAAAVQAADGRLLYGGPALAELCAATEAPCDGWLRARLEHASGSTHEWLAHAHTLHDGGRYIIGYDILPMLDRIYPVTLAAGLSLLMLLLINLGVGLAFSLSAMRRINRIRQAMARFARGELDSRVALRGRADEFDQLGDDVNHALARINHLMEAVRNATNHIAHELRTPLTRLQQRLSNIAEAAHGDRAVALELALAEEEMQQIQTLFRAVMRISEVETGRCLHETAPIDIAALLRDVHDYYEVLAEQRHITLRCELAVTEPFFGDRALLLQALVNLLDNAVKYAPSGSCVTLIARSNASLLELGVADEGQGIAPAQRARAMQRFQRLTRDRSIPGHGLGLALVQAIAGLHGGQLVLCDNDLRAAPDAQIGQQPGLLALLRLPMLAHATGTLTTPQTQKCD